MGLTLGVDVGGTKILAAVVDEAGQIIEERRVASPATDASAICGVITKLALDLTSKHLIEAIGVGAAGYINRARSTVMFAPNIAWRDVDLKTPIQEATGLPTVIENDANAAAWGEFTFGAGAQAESFLLVTVGTGVGGGLVLEGELQRGGFGVAAEIGHLRVMPGGIQCGCGNFGCLEAYASGNALVRVGQELAAEAGPSRLLDLAGGVASAINGPMITAAALEADPVAIEAFGHVGRWLGEGIASLTAIVDPEMIVLGGGVSEAGDLLLEPVRAAFADQLTGRGHRPMAEISLATLGNRAGVIGAADLARHRGPLEA